MRDLAAAVGMSPAAIYHYFNSKDAIMAALIEGSAEGPRRGIGRLPVGGSLRDVLYSAGAGFLGAISTSGARDRLEVVFLAAHHRPDWAAEYLAGLSDPTEVGLADAIGIALPVGARGRVEPRWVAKQLVGALLSFVLHEEVLRRGGESAPARDGYLRQVVDIIAAGVEGLGRAGA